MVYHQYGFSHVSLKHLMLVTLGAAEWFITSVSYFIAGQMSCLTELLVTFRTAEWFIISVDYDVSSKY